MPSARAAAFFASAAPRELKAIVGASGDSSGTIKPNRDFVDLWLRFVSSAAQFGLQDRPAFGRSPLAVSGEPLRAAVTEDEAMEL